MAGHLDRLFDYVEFGDADREELRRFHARAAPHFVAITDVFYDRILSDADARDVFRDQAQLERLKLTLVGWLDRLLAGPWDDEYFELRSRIGRVHTEVALPQRFMLLAMSVVRVELHRLAVATSAGDPEAAARLLEALGKILDVDLALMLESYREDSLASVKRLEEVERHFLARELELSRERYRAVLETAEVVAVAVTDEGLISLFNRHAETVTGYSRPEILELSDFEALWHPTDAGAAASALAEVRAGHDSRVMELRLISKSEESRCVRWHITRLSGIDGGEVCFVGVDLTEERALAARTHAAERLATVGTLAAGLAHEIRNPLNAAQLQLTLARRRLARGTPEAVQIALEATSVVEDEIGRLTALVSDFLAYARPAPLRARATDLRDVARGVIELLGPEAPDTELALVAPEVVGVHCDAERIRQVLYNLVRNAIEAAGAGGRVSVRVVRRGPRALLEVSDTGAGIPDDVEIFQPFATSKEGGTGLGLSIVDRIISDHHGTIEAVRDGDWTRLRVELPVAGPGGAVAASES